ncbi:uncharacterized protein LOC111712749 [Eurytemora carolleeae]|uniref:uncharacterized protein LOC111712749 n=1 Tax=Eurytemora carolleeae TaxID=1294199 RepID=UPI000C773152|nr:uncharacterized protein LOC111712749 [Eurytemora carolleeae]|eukprot:XP_023343226.1 uncharacterized protein LOC111712749 [Eurytemora affinis]
MALSFSLLFLMVLSPALISSSNTKDSWIIPRSNSISQTDRDYFNIIQTEDGVSQYFILKEILQLSSKLPNMKPTSSELNIKSSNKRSKNPFVAKQNKKKRK